MSVSEPDAGHADERHHHAGQGHEMAGQAGPGHETRAVRGEMVGRVNHRARQHDSEAGPHQRWERAKNGQDQAPGSINQFHYPYTEPDDTPLAPYRQPLLVLEILVAVREAGWAFLDQRPDALAVVVAADHVFDEAVGFAG